ncbi:MAG: DNA topoisomerase IV subunit A [Bacilli bacterium]
MNNKNAKKKNLSALIENFVSEKILEETLEDIVSERFARYSKYIIQDRALPDARDGLKPVQRRILFAMYKLGMFANKPYKKSARIVGDVIGKYHPHGDTSVYEAMVRLSQNFKMLLPLIDMHGNNGSMDGDPAAAMRYTEARLSKYAEYLLQDINKKTVGFVPNFDDEEYEPTVLPAKFPNLLVNGASGISAGYATEIPPHNLDEVIKAVIYLIDHPNATISDLMKIINGPDFPTGGIVQGIDGIRNAYETGRGKISLNSKTSVVEKDNMNQLVISEIPFEVNKAMLVKKMSEVYVQKNVDGIIDIRDESDRQGLRIVVDLRKDANPEFIKNFFMKSTELSINYNFNMVVIANKRPMLMNLKDLLSSYIDHQREVITNRSNYELNQAKRRLHIVNGLIAMTSIIESVIQTIRNSANKKDAKDNLISNYNFSEEQAEAIVMLQLYRLTNTDIVMLREEEENLKALVVKLSEILSNETILLNTIKAELQLTMQTLSTPRKSVIEHEIDELKVEVKELIAKEDAVIIITNDGYIKRMTPKVYANNEETKLKDEDVIIATYEVTTTDTLLLFTNLGNYVFLPISKIPEVKHKDLGYNVSTLASIEANEKIIFTVPIDDFEKDRYLLFTTKNGLIKRTHIRELNANRYSRALKATKIREEDELISVDISSEDRTEVVVVTKEGYINRYDAEEISIMAPPSFGVKAIELKNRPYDEVVGGHYISQKDFIVILTLKATIKRLRPDEIIKGKKNNVGKPYLMITKSSPNFALSSQIIHRKNANLNLDCYLFGVKGHVSVDFNTVKNATAQTGKKITNTDIGKPEKLVIVRNNNDFE